MPLVKRWPCSRIWLTIDSIHFLVAWPAVCRHVLGASSAAYQMEIGRTFPLALKYSGHHLDEPAQSQTRTTQRRRVASLHDQTTFLFAPPPQLPKLSWTSLRKHKTFANQCINQPLCTVRSAVCPRFDPQFVTSDLGAPLLPWFG